MLVFYNSDGTAEVHLGFSLQNWVRVYIMSKIIVDLQPVEPQCSELYYDILKFYI